MKRDLPKDLERIKPLCSPGRTQRGRYWKDFTAAIHRSTIIPTPNCSGKSGDWLCVPLFRFGRLISMGWPNILDGIESTGAVDTDILKLVKLAGALPNGETIAAVASFEHGGGIGQL